VHIPIEATGHENDSEAVTARGDKKTVVVAKKDIDELPFVDAQERFALLSYVTHVTHIVDV
jgi:hypothetical protein